MHTYFDILCDKYGNPYFTDAEKDTLLNRAQLSFVDQVVQQAETNDNILNKISTLIVSGTAVQMSSSGEVTVSAVATATGVTPYKVLKVYEDGVGAVSQVSHNNSGPARSNYFKAQRRRFEQLGTKWLFYPISTTASLVFTVIAYPTTITKGSSNSNIPDLSHNEIVAQAINLAGIATRDEALAQLNQMNK